MPRSARVARPQPSPASAGVDPLTVLVLVADDLADQRELYGGYLDYLSYEVALATDGIDAIAKAMELRPDVIVMDLAMPDVDGFQATRVLKRIPSTSGIPVIALTAFSDSLPAEWAEEAGCDLFLSKPVLPQDLAKAIEALLSQRRRRT